MGYHCLEKYVDTNIVWAMSLSPIFITFVTITNKKFYIIIIYIILIKIKSTNEVT